MEPVALVQGLESLNVACADTSDVIVGLRRIQQLRGWLNSLESQLTRRQATHHETGNGLSPQDVIARGSHTSRREAAKATRRAEVLGKTPAVDKQLAAGRISTEHADALANAVNKLDDDQQQMLLDQDTELAQAATSQTPEQFKRFLGRTTDQMAADHGVERSERQRHAATVTRGIDERTGMGYINATLHPDDWQKVNRKLDAEIAVLRKQPDHQNLRTDQLAAVAYTNIMTSQRSAAQPPPEVMILIDLDTITNGLRAESVCEYSDGIPLPVATARRHACNANIIPAVLDSDGQPVDVGRETRLANRQQRRALRAMYRTCAIGGCDQHFDRCEIHHLLEWDNHGPTDLANLIPICSYHHHRIHEGRWQLQLDPSTRQLTVRMPDRTLHSRSLPDHMEQRRHPRPSCTALDPASSTAA